MASSSEASDAGTFGVEPASADAADADAADADADGTDSSGADRSTPSDGDSGQVRSLLVGAIPPAVAVATFLLGASEVAVRPLALGTLGFLLTGAVAYGWYLGDGGWDAFGRGFVGAAVGLPVGFAITGAVISVQNGFSAAHLGASLVVFALVGGLGVFLLIPYPVVAGLTGAIAARR